jgi:hypothetical protein
LIDEEAAGKRKVVLRVGSSSFYLLIDEEAACKRKAVLRLDNLLLIYLD